MGVSHAQGGSGSPAAVHLRVPAHCNVFNYFALFVTVYYNSIYKCMHAHVHLFTSHHLHFRYLSLNHRCYHRVLARLVRAFLSLPSRYANGPEVH